jgi:hypothetical protein
MIVVGSLHGVPQSEQTTDRSEVPDAEAQHPHAAHRASSPIPERHLFHAPALAVRLNQKLWLDVEAATSGLADILKNALSVHPEATREVAVWEREDFSIEEVEELAEDATDEPHLGIRAAYEARRDQHVALIAVVPHRPHVAGAVGKVPVHGDDVRAGSSCQARSEYRAVSGTLGLDELGSELVCQRLDIMIVGTGSDDDERPGD